MSVPSVDLRNLHSRSYQWVAGAQTATHVLGDASEYECHVAKATPPAGDYEGVAAFHASPDTCRWWMWLYPWNDQKPNLQSSFVTADLENNEETWLVTSVLSEQLGVYELEAVLQRTDT